VYYGGGKTGAYDHNDNYAFRNGEAYASDD
jgi:hypothetical protein